LRSRKIVKWFAVIGFAVIGTVLIVLGMELKSGRVRLTTYDQIASVVSMFAGLAGLAIAVVQLRQRPAPQATDEPEQRDRVAETPAEAVERQGEEEARVRMPTGPASVISPSEPARERGTRAGQVWNIPGPVRSFTGRDTQLAKLHNQLETGQQAALIPSPPCTAWEGSARLSSPAPMPPSPQGLPARLVDPGRVAPDDRHRARRAGGAPGCPSCATSTTAADLCK
jgi:hypothetical protein